MDHVSFFTSERQVAALAAAFYRRSIPLSKWNKAAQLTVTLYYALRFPQKMAYELLHQRMREMSGGRLGRETSSELESAIRDWLDTARSFAARYGNIDDMAALANIFIASFWIQDCPYPQLFDPVLAEADTAKLPDRPALLVPLPA